MKYKLKIKDCRLMIDVKLSSKEKLNEKAFGSFCRVNVRGLMKAMTEKKLGKTHVRYTGPVGIPLSDRLAKPVDSYDFLFIMEQVVDIVQRMQINVLNTDDVIWDIHHVYINETTKEVQFLYLPMENQSPVYDIREFLESIIYAMNVAQGENAEYISEFAYFIKSMDRFDPNKIEAFIRNKNKQIVSTIKRHYAGQSGFITDKPRDYYEHYGAGEDATGLMNGENGEDTGVLDDEDATGILDDDVATGILDAENDPYDDGAEETTLLQKPQVVRYPTLRRVLTDETVEVNKASFRIGKEKQYVDCFVSNNSAVSRSHADILTHGDKCFIKDLNSKNGTYVNGQPVLAQQEVELSDGDQIRLANEEFIFYY